MADRTQLRAADHNDIADDDPFAELTRIMGFDPRQPVESQRPGKRKADAGPVADEGYSDIDLDKELLGEFGAYDSDPALVGGAHDLAFETADTDASDDRLSLPLDDDFELDMADIVGHAASAGHTGAGSADTSPILDPVFDADFDNAVASSLEDVSPFEDDQPMEDELAASLDRSFRIAEEVERPYAAPAVDVEPALDHEFDHALAISLEDELMLDEQPSVRHPAYDAPAAEAVPVRGHDAQTIDDEDFTGHFEDAMADVDMDFDIQADEPLVSSVFQEARSAHNTGGDVADYASGYASGATSDDSFDMDFDDAFAVAAEEPVAAVAPVTPAPAVAEPAPVAAKDERSLEDELNALLGAMTARTTPTREPVATQSAPVQPPAKAAEEPADLVGDLDWGLDEPAPLGSHHLDAGQDEVKVDNGPSVVASTKDMNTRDAATSTTDPLDWLAERSAPAEQARSWSRVTPVPQAPVLAAQPTAAMAASAMSPAVVPSYRSTEADAYTAPIYASQQRQPARHEEMPDVETVDVPERVVALADDLDIPELHFEDDEPATAGYDDLDAEFASLLTDMNSMDVAAAPAANASSASYDDEFDNAGFNSGYATVKPAYQPEARTYAARPTEMPVRPAAPTAYADADGFDLDNLPGSQQADDFTVDELDYDPELDEAMTVPGIGEREAARPSRGRGLFIVAIVGAVAVVGGLGAFALSLGGKGGNEPPVIVKADNSPIKVKPENPGGTVVPNQDNKVYDAVVKGAKPTEPVQEKLVTNSEEPVDVQAKDPARAIDLSADAANDADAVGDSADAADDAAAPAPKSEDRIAQVLQDSDQGANVIAVAPRKVKTMVVKSDGSLVAREDAAPAAPQVAATEPADPAPQHVAPSTQADADQTGTVPPPAAQAVEESALKPAAKPKAEAQSANTPAKVPVAPQRPSDQPVDVVGEVKPDQVASIDPASTAASGGSWSMQIASQPTVESAQSSYQDLQRRYGSVLAGRTANIVKAEIAGKGTFYRVRVPAQSRNDAINLCTSYKAAGGNCFVSR
ncbi:SPOR domain-containing protein [Mesorhizobium sp. ES1-1]|uniref:SPOR domain-containing protein n=1 Tax=Mesorhizobium sp. ES1-1 TaxID=2876629 RepID=UPI001CC96CC5|nr:SPOR domain-containing protein [Mesorhizobium sp. ES1-1]MBZ9677234.1 SPOR domain-containing protein [Mesorhizobium sp. ES1-1]